MLFNNIKVKGKAVFTGNLIRGIIYDLDEPVSGIITHSAKGSSPYRVDFYKDGATSRFNFSNALTQYGERIGRNPNAVDEFKRISVSVDVEEFMLCRGTANQTHPEVYEEATNTTTHQVLKGEQI